MDPMNRSSSSAALLVGAVAVPIAVCAVLSALIDVFVAPAAALVLVLVIVIVCLRGSWLVDALVIVVSAIGFDFFLTYPYRSMKIASRPDIEVTIVLFVVGAAIAGISRWALTASDLAERRQGYVTYALDARSGDMSRDEVAQRLAGLVGAEAGAWVDGTPPSGEAVIQDATAMRTDVGLEDPSRVGFPTDRFICFPAAGGYIRISAASRHVRPTAEQMRAACLLASQIS